MKCLLLQSCDCTVQGFQTCDLQAAHDRQLAGMWPAGNRLRVPPSHVWSAKNDLMSPIHFRSKHSFALMTYSPGLYCSLFISFMLRFSFRFPALRCRSPVRQFRYYRLQARSPRSKTHVGCTNSRSTRADAKDRDMSSGFFPSAKVWSLVFT